MVWNPSEVVGIVSSRMIKADDEAAAEGQQVYYKGRVWRPASYFI